MLDDSHRARVLEARDSYERVFREVLAEGSSDGTFQTVNDPKTNAIFVLSILNAVERWYRPSGALDRQGLVDELSAFILNAIGF